MNSYGKAEVVVLYSSVSQLLSATGWKRLSMLALPLLCAIKGGEH